MNFVTAEWRTTIQLPAEREGNCTTARVILLPSAICTVMAIIAAITAELSSLYVRPLFAPYLSTGIAMSLLAVLTYVFIQFAKLARNSTDNPFAIVTPMVVERLPVMILPALALPVFLIGYTAAKCAIQFLVGYSWDPFFANADRFIFGDDVWHLTRTILGSSTSSVWEWFYTVGWGYVFFMTANAVALFGSRRFVGVYFTAMLGSWLIGGCVLAYVFSAAGPAFAGLFHPELVQRFLPMHEAMSASLRDGPIASTQHYLAKSIGVHAAPKGGGISAMPSMHLATASIYVLAARRTPWLVPSVAFWLIIFVASGYFGYHYWVDGLAAAIVAAFLWRVSEAAFGSSRHNEFGGTTRRKFVSALKLAEKAR